VGGLEGIGGFYGPRPAASRFPASPYAAARNGPESPATRARLLL